MTHLRNKKKKIAGLMEPESPISKTHTKQNTAAA
jgi:hypothetical protein